MGERAGETIGTLARQLGLVTRDEIEELELKVAQLEHRLRLVEDALSPETVKTVASAGFGLQMMQH